MITNNDLHDDFRPRRKKSPTIQLTPLIYPGREPQESAKHCKMCGTRQKRFCTIRGPLKITECLDVDPRLPRVSGSTFWRIFGLGLVSPPSPPHPDRWYVITEKAECPKCNEKHPEKKYRRQFGLQRLFCLHLTAMFSNSVEFIPVL